MIKSYAPEIPLELDEKGNFIYIKDILKNCRQNLKMILLTSPGEKIYDPQFGIGIHKYIFEPTNGIVSKSEEDDGALQISDFQDDISQKLALQVAKYAPDIYIKDISISVNDLTLKISVEYNYKNYISDTLTVSTEA